jgi:hypothetical protein
MSVQDSYIQILKLVLVEEQDYVAIAEFAINELDNGSLPKPRCPSCQ